jgi:transcriptional regulator with XRE-family HTH domain
MKHKTSLRELAKRLGVSASYLSQVKNGKRPPSEKLLSNTSFEMLSKVLSNEVDARMSTTYNSVARVCPSSTMVAQPICNR